MRKGFVSTMREGFHMTFENGLTVSVQWGAGNYCDNYCPEDLDFSFKKDAASNTAEVAILRGNEFLNPQDFVSYEIGGDGEVVGYLSPSEVVDLLIAARDWDGCRP